MTPQSERWVRLAGGIAAALAFAAIATGLSRSHVVYDKGAAEFGMDDPIRITEKQLNADATFSGVESSRKTGKMLSTYDRSQPPGKRACPT
jgi:hypothetical protein